MTYAYSPNAVLRDVTLRDGLQLTGKLLPTERKVEIARQLLALGVPELEIGSMARGDLVPPMANTRPPGNKTNWCCRRAKYFIGRLTATD